MKQNAISNSFAHDVKPCIMVKMCCKASLFLFRKIVMPESVGTIVFGFAQPFCDAGLPHPASKISNRLEHTLATQQGDIAYDQIIVRILQFFPFD